MALTLWIQTTWLYQVFYNALIGFSHLLPGGKIWISIIVMTVVVRILLLPFSYKAIVHQIIQKRIEPERKRIQEEYKDNKTLQAEKMLELMKANKTNPFSSCLLTLVQIPLIFVLYTVFLTGLTINPDLLYSFVGAPESLHLGFLGFDLGAKSIVFGLVTGIVQYIQIKLSPVMKDSGVQQNSDDPQALMLNSMQKTMKFSLPIMIAVFASVVPAAVALYWTVSNLFTIGQEMYIQRKLDKGEEIV